MELCEMALFYDQSGLWIQYDENNNKLISSKKLNVCDDIAQLIGYAYVCVNDIILFFGGLDIEDQCSNLVYIYSMRDHSWTKCNDLPSPLNSGVAILNGDQSYIHLIGGENGDKHLKTHLKTRVDKWIVNHSPMKMQSNEWNEFNELNEEKKKQQLKEEKEKEIEEIEEIEGIEKMLRNAFDLCFLYVDTISSRSNFLGRLYIKFSPGLF